jgi:rubrerythrin
MKLGTFGAIISFALELERQALEYYESLKGSVVSQPSSQILTGSQKRLRRLRRIRQELVTEMILEPISGVDSDDYVLSISEGSDEAERLNQAIRLEENMNRFYSTSAYLIPMKEVERAFLRLAQENESRLVSFKNIIANI